ncbi:DUF3656 domain-containing protein, partial [filamentous cyanobacterium LEGE 11480]
PYDLIADGKTVDVGGRKYLLSPQDLSGLDVLPDIVESGVTCLKIEGRLKAPEYVANVTRVYRQALNRIIDQVNPHENAKADRYSLEMAFSRGLYTGWFEGIDNQALVHAEFGKKRGVYLGDVTRVQAQQVTIAAAAPMKPGDGVVFDCGHPEEREEGGRIYSVTAAKPKGRGPRGPRTQAHELVLTFGKGSVDFRNVCVGDRLWKTSDHELDKQVRQSYAKENAFQRPIQIEVHGEVDQSLVVIARDERGNVAQVESEMPLVAAHSKPLTGEKLLAQLGRLGNTPLRLEDLKNHLEGDVLVPVSELNRMRRAIVDRLMDLRSRPKRWQFKPAAEFQALLPEPAPFPDYFPELKVLVRKLAQVEAVLPTGISTLYCEFEDPRNYKAAVQLVRQWNTAHDDKIEVWVAPPRIAKPSENWILEQVSKSQADGYLIRNYDHLKYFADQRCIGDFSLNVANAITANYFKSNFNLEKITASYDLNINQLDDLLSTAPSDWFDITIHQHMPMFHMEHCVFCAFLSDGTDFTNCGRPCDEHEVKLRDRVGTEHILQADAGCRNTVFNGKAQTGAEHVQRLIDRGARYFRIDFLNETPQQIQHTIAYYQQLLKGEISGVELWKALQLQSQLGVTRGTIEKR